MNEKEQLKKAISKIPRVKLVDLPTPLHDCPRFSEAVGGVRVLIKRDDMTGLAFGGNKSRQHEFILGDATAQGANAIIHGAASQSNYSRQLCAACAKLGLKAFIVGKRDLRSQMVGIQGNLLLDHILGADVRLAEDQSKAKKELFEELRKQGYVPYTTDQRKDIVFATVAYTNCALEIHDQLAQLDAKADYVVLCSTSGTQAGLALGGKVLNMGYRTIGFRPSKGGNNEDIISSIASLANEAAEILGLDIRVEEDELENYEDYVGEAYGIVTKEGLDALQLLARTEGILLDPVYVGKAMSGLIDWIRTGKIASGKTVIFVHTGGIPALFAYNKELIEHGGYKIRIAEEE